MSNTLKIEIVIVIVLLVAFILIPSGSKKKFQSGSTMYEHNVKGGTVIEGQNNAVANVDITSGTVTIVSPFGVKGGLTAYVCDKFTEPDEELLKPQASDSSDDSDDADDSGADNSGADDSGNDENNSDSDDNDDDDSDGNSDDSDDSDDDDDSDGNSDDSDDSDDGDDSDGDSDDSSDDDDSDDDDVDQSQKPIKQGEVVENPGSSAVLTADLRLRSSMSTENEDNLVTALIKGTDVEVIEANLTGNDEKVKLWCHVKVAQYEGYLAQGYLEFE
ncbi:MAG: hypothetical protein K5848_02225 [Lachnospiraceae bacterium]|nr:hypothetical protein [Lachnospiraceae bacterium]